MRLLTKQDILASELKKEKLHIPEWDGFVFISELGADARDEFEQFVVAERQNLQPKRTAGQKKLQPKKTEYLHVRAALAAATVVGETGERLFSLSDAVALGKKSGRAMDRIFDAANKLNKIYGQEREDAEKNSETPQGDSPDGE